jgi:hypothetical protein
MGGEFRPFGLEVQQDKVAPVLVLSHVIVLSYARLRETETSVFYVLVLRKLISETIC